MEHDPYNTTAEVVGATEIRLEFHCDTGEGQNLEFGGHTGSPTCGEVIYNLIHDPAQSDHCIQVDHTFDGMMAGQSEVLVLVREGGDIKGRKIVIIQ
ncbi:hypothetical protein KFE98_19555 [bacterium SCSIO 12741]|nr:hypothetical protein KFE98_19555 [bacterium SCSIO 12741]